MTLSPWFDAAGVIILWHFRSPLLILIFLSVAFPNIPLEIGMYFQTLLSPLLKAPRMALLSLLLCECYGLISPAMGKEFHSDVSPVNNSDSENFEFCKFQFQTVLFR